MREITFVMGIPAAGKSTYIKDNYNDSYVKLDLLEYQKVLWPDWHHPSVEEVMQSYMNLLEGIKKNIKENDKDIIVEHTLLKACRREIYLNALREYDVELKIICIMVEESKYTYCNYEGYMEVLEEPTVEEGWKEVNIIWR